MRWLRGCRVSLTCEMVAPRRAPAIFRLDGQIGLAGRLDPLGRRRNSSTGTRSSIWLTVKRKPIFPTGSKRPPRPPTPSRHRRQEASVEVYEMGSLLDAYGIYSSMREADSKPVNVGTEGFAGINPDHVLRRQVLRQGARSTRRRPRTSCWDSPGRWPLNCRRTRKSPANGLGRDTRSCAARANSISERACWDMPIGQRA